MISEEFCNDEFWNSSLVFDPVNPDLTFCFKNSVLIWVPCGFLWLFSPFDIYQRHKSRFNHIPFSVLNILKYLFIYQLIALSLVDLAMMITVESKGIQIYGVQFVSIGVKILTFSLAAYLQILHKSKGHRASKYIFIFWCLISFCSIPQLRWEIRNFNVDFTMQDTFWHSYHLFSFAIFSTLIWLMTIASAFCDKPPKCSSYPKSTNVSRQLSAGALSQLFFSWFSPTTWLGWKRPLTEADIPDVNPQFASSELVPVFDKNFHKSIEDNAKKSSKNNINDETVELTPTHGRIVITLWRSFGGELLVSLLLRIIIDLLQFAQPFLLLLLIGYISASGALWKGLFLTFTFFAVAFILAFMNGQQQLIAYHVGVKIRTTLISAIYRKALKISSSAKKNTTVGEIVNLMAVDAHRFYEMSPYILVGITAPMVMGLALYFLYLVIGASAFAGLAALIAMFPISGFLASRMQTLQYKQMGVKDERVKSISEILAGIKVIKFYAWEPSFQKTIDETRDRELKYLRSAAVLNAATEFIWTLTPFLVSFVTFTTYVMLGNALEADVAFVSIALFNILRLPMFMLPITINFFMMAWVSVRRLNKFMNYKEIDQNNVTNDPSEFALSIKLGNFSWIKQELVLKNINLGVKKGNLTAVVGIVGSGKSSLISALLGEMEKLSGIVNVDGSLAYVSQVAWIQNATLMDNILFGKPLNKAFYEKIIHACALTADLAMLPAGDQTEIGEKGINLSGGQKQRVALARAVYSGADIYILDDPLSAVDSHVGKHIFENILGGKGLLRDKTRFLVTHAISYLPKVDEIIVMKDGEITESGSYRELLTQKGAFSEFIVLYLQEHGDDEDLSEIKSELKVEDIKSILQLSKSRTTRTSGKASESQSINVDVRQRTTSKQNEDIATGETSKNVDGDGELAGDTLIESETAAVGNVAFGVYVRYFKSVGFLLIAFVFVSVFSSEASSVLSNFWITRWVASEAAATDNSVRNFFVATYGIFGFLLALTYFSGAISFAFGAIRAARNLHARLFYNILRLPISFFDTTPLGRIVNRFSRDTDMIDAYLPAILFSWVAMFFNVFGTIFVISYATPWFLVVVVPLSIAYYFFQKFYISTSRQLKRLESITRSPIYSHFSESISGQSIIRAYKEEKRFTFESETRVDKNQGIAYQSLIADMWLGVRLEIVGAFIVLFACLFAILARYDIEEATVGLSISYALQVSAVLSYFVMVTTEVETNIVSVERVEEYTNLPQEAPWKNSFKIDDAWPMNGIIEFKDFEVRYRAGLELVLKGISFTCSSQEKIGIVGRTGAGKSSMTLSLFRIIEASGGKIIIDGINIADIGLHSLRNRLTIIPQDPVLFSGSLRMNIDPFNSYSDDEIWKALEHSHLKAFVKTLPEGLTFKVSEGGENLSVGQRQLVCLARALLRKTKVLILDEATAAIDIETDELIQNTIRDQFSDCTILTIAHRLNTIMDSDRIIVLEQGKIAEFDTPSNLLADSRSIFYGMAKDAGIVE